MNYLQKNNSSLTKVPGMAGSQIEASVNRSTAQAYCQKVSDGYINIWLNSASLSSHFLECWIDNFRLIYNGRTRKTYCPDGVVTKIPGWGDTSTVEYLDPRIPSPRQRVFGAHGSYFMEIANMLVDKLGYLRNVSLRGAPYDFRRGPDENVEYFTKLKTLVEETYRMNNNEKVTFIAHSMGGSMALIFLRLQTQAWKDKYVSSLLTLSGVWEGSVKALQILATGDNMSTHLLNARTLRKLLVTFPSFGWLLPTKPLTDDGVLVTTEFKNYTQADLRQYLLEIGVPNAWEFYKNNRRNKFDSRPPGVRVYCLYGDIRYSTVQRLLYRPGVSFNDAPELIFGDGDGSVNKKSLEGCLDWIDKQSQEIYYRSFPHVDHYGMLRNENILDYIESVLEVD
ncbi:group XV phospholipase A2-like [Copidosoma floridanum]|uniref:group XV phospholipase A2-like n=1 Tax=Copidosoma floridanum TaxID=29053 RepID=UPI0006C99F04|nr:group XV phospholipase A2-like [Copidosoma floridanum]